MSNKPAAQLEPQYRIYQPLGHDLAIAYIKNQMGITFATAEKNHKDLEPGVYWLMLAELVSHTFYDEINKGDVARLILEFRSRREGSVN